VTVEPVEVAVDDQARHRLRTLAREISERGALRSPQWHRVFTTVRRHVFLPRYLHDEEPGAIPARWRVVDGANPADRHEWLSSVYSDTTLIVDLKGQLIRRNAAVATTRSSPALPPCPA
jgi:hypothetical protein